MTELATLLQARLDELKATLKRTAAWNTILRAYLRGQINATRHCLLDVRKGAKP